MYEYAGTPLNIHVTSLKFVPISVSKNPAEPVSARLCGAYGMDKVYVGSPCIVNKDGATRRVELTLMNNELKKFKESCQLLDETFAGLEF